MARSRRLPSLSSLLILKTKAALPLSAADADGHIGDFAGADTPDLESTEILLNGNDPAVDAQDQQAQQQSNGQGQQTQTDSAGHPINKDAIANYIDQHAEKSSRHACAAYCRRAFEAGGVDTSGHPVDAKDWGPTLLKNGAAIVSPDGYTPQKADVAVFAGNHDHPFGHITVYDGKQWVSDFKQRNMSPYRTAPPVTIYRFPGN